MKRVLFGAAALLALVQSGAAQEITVSPASANVYSQGATSLLLTYGGVKDKRPVEACWCGDLVEAAPDIGLKCNPATVFGCLPVRYNQSKLSANAAYTDIMSIPPAVARRAYMDAAAGARATFYYVRRFVSTVGEPDEFVVVTLRLSGNGAAAPFSLTDVKLSWGVNKPVLLVKAGEKLPPIKAEIRYTGTGRLKGRWEIVKPGEELPTPRDLLTEAALPIEERGLQRRYTELSRFNVYLPPTGQFTLAGPESWPVPSGVDGLYLVLLRIEATNDGQGDSDLRIVGAGPGVAQGGAVAGFALPVLRYYVGASSGQPAAPAGGKLAQLLPAENSTLPADGPVDFSWSETKGAAFYRLEVEDAQGRAVLSAVLSPGVGAYRAPSWLKEKITDAMLRWRVAALDQAGAQIAETPWQTVRLAAKN